jgi:hypothetical protein
MAATAAAPAVTTAAQEKDRILELLSQGEDLHWQIGVHYNTIVDRGLAQAAGYKTAQEFFAEELKAISQATLSLYGAVAKAFSEADAKKHGTTRLGHLLTYESLTHTAPAQDVGETVVLVPARDGGPAQPRRFADCSVADLVAAIKAQRTPPTPVPAEDAQKVERMKAALVLALGEHHIVAVAAKMCGRAAVLSIEGVPMAQAATVLDALKTAL